MSVYFHVAYKCFDFVDACLVTIEVIIFTTVVRKVYNSILALYI